MKMYFLAGALSFLATTTSRAQTTIKSVFAEAGGPGFASINFDTRFKNMDGGLGGRIGIGGFELDNDKFIAIPVAIDYLIPSGYSNFFEVGAGYTHLLGLFDYGRPVDDVFHHPFGHVSLGYRLLPGESKFQFRVALTPVFNSYGIVPFYGALSIGLQL